MKGHVVGRKGNKAIVETALGRVIVDLRNVVESKPSRSRISVHVSEREHTRVEPANDSAESDLDLHQRTVDEVENLLSKFLDEAAVAGRQRVKIIHGKGTGKLRREVVRLLKTHSIVSHFESAQPHDGSYGVTIAYLK